jgi:DNA-binding response OmpR family regulator
VGTLTIDRQRFSADLAGVQLGLTPLEFDLLDALVRNMGSVVAYQDMVERVMGTRFVPESSALRVHITNLRRKLGPAGPCIVTVRGRGLLFEPSVLVRG